MYLIQIVRRDCSHAFLVSHLEPPCYSGVGAGSTVERRRGQSCMTRPVMGSARHELHIHDVSALVRQQTAAAVSRVASPQSHLGHQRTPAAAEPSPLLPCTPRSCCKWLLQPAIEDEASPPTPRWLPCRQDCVIFFISLTVPAAPPWHGERKVREHWVCRPQLQ